MTFDLQLFPVTYAGKTFHLGNLSGVIPVEGLGPMVSSPDGTTKPVPMATGSKLIIAPEDPMIKLQIEQTKGNISLIDERNSSLEPFSIGRDVYQKNVWQPTLEIYFPVQMCHMRIRDRSRVWHGACHLDDALQAPVSTIHVDGYQTYATTETSYKPFTTVPGLNRGGWHDAGDNDLAAGSQAQTTLFLALAGEEFGIDVDQTTIMQHALYVELRKPDGRPDLLQQIEHGVINLLSGYHASGHSFVGIIENREGRDFLGDVASVTDQLFYDSSLKPGEIKGNRSGNNDDRWVVTNKDASLEYEVMTSLAAASRLLKGFNMHWWSYIPGGMVSGTALIRPDFPELKEPFPYLWQQTEYVMPGASTYIFCVLAADNLLNGKSL